MNPSALPPNALALDFETFYDKTDYSIRTHGVYAYLRDSRADVYLVSVHGPGVRFVGHPRDFDWSLTHGRLLLAHNASFDWHVTRRLQETGVIPAGVQPAGWNCTANLAAYFRVPRDLAAAAKELLQRESSKDVRAEASGKRWEAMKPSFQREMVLYAARDAELCYELARKLWPYWPLVERRFSELTLLQAQHGIAVDDYRLWQDIDLLQAQINHSLELLPWVPALTPLSVKGLGIACAKVGIEPPKSLAMGDEDAEAWLERHDETYPFVRGMRAYRRLNALKKKIESILIRTDPGTKRCFFELKYFGTHTGRDSASGGLNPQNLPREKMFGVDLRSAFIAPTGKKLGVVDLSQVEARVTLYLAGDWDQIKLLREGMNPYEAHARATMGWTGGTLKDADKRKYLLAKARVLALGYGCGWRRFIVMAYLPAYLGKEAQAVFSMPVTKGQIAEFEAYLFAYEKDPAIQARWVMGDEALIREWVNSWLIVTDFRARNPKIQALWHLFDDGLKQSVGRDYRIELPSGRTLQYRNVAESKGEITARVCQHDRWAWIPVYGGMCTANAVSAVARDLFRDNCLRIHEQTGYPFLMRTHDEAVVEMPEEDDVKTLETLMSVTPDWLPGCPLAAEAQALQRYAK